MKHHILLLLVSLLTFQFAHASEALKSKTKLADVGTRKIAYRSIGQGTPLILANRFRGDLDQWDPAFLDSLAKNFRVITFDYSGLGRSTGTQAEDVMEMAKDVIDLTSALKIQKFVIGGWSMGGFVAQVVLTEHPDKVTHGILIGTRPPGKSIAPPPKLFFENALIPNYTVENDYILFFNRKYEESKKAARASRERISMRTKDRDKTITKDQWEKMLALKGFSDDAHGTEKKLIESNIPILVIAGEDDVSFPVKDWFDANGKFPSVNLMVLGKTGHGPQHQYPEFSSQLINQFVKTMKPESISSKVSLKK